IMKRRTIKDIAKESGFSLSTVSLVLNNHPRISQSTRDRVMEVVRKYDFHPNSAARGLASKSSRTLSVVIPNLSRVFSDIYLGEIISGIYERATSQGYKILLDIATAQFIESQEYSKLLASRRADGMLFIASDIHADYLHVFEDSPYPFLLVNHLFPGKRLNYVAVDYASSARLAAEHLLGLGHRRIGLIAGTNTHTGLIFRDEFLRACKSWPAGAADVTWVDGGEEWSQRGGYAATAKLMDLKPGLTAIMAANDRMALGAMRWMVDHHLEVPEDVSVMGVDDIQIAAYVNPGLSTVRHDLYQVGIEACNRLLQLMNGQIKECSDLLPTSLVVRGSTGRVPSGK
ncbi:MAG: LacI family DNA-binding transcriptional regulator, partial [Kiritimatiellae bacterium]|nr:LacI family DNA-binding transcriptional regulator [Kiritimatiellia bacterium]